MTQPQTRIGRGAGRALLPAGMLAVGLIPADAACQLQLLNAVPMQVMDNRVVLQAQVNGADRNFALDTAAIANQVTAESARGMGLGGSGLADYAGVSGSGAAAQNLGLRGASLSGQARAVYNDKGVMFQNVVTAKDFLLGAMHNNGIDFVITDLPPPGVDGLINVEMFHRFDIDFNFASRSFNTFSPDHCRGQILYWRAPGVAALPFRSRDNRIVATVLLEGREVLAVIDTGSPVSEVRFQDAKRLFDLTPDSPGVTLVGERHDNPVLDRYAYDFKTLSFGKVAIGNPHLLLTRDILVRGANPSPRTGSRIQNDADDVQPALLIGTDILRYLHLYVAFGERMLYVTQGPEMASDAPGALPTVAVDPFRP